MVTHTETLYLLRLAKSTKRIDFTRQIERTEHAH